MFINKNRNRKNAFSNNIGGIGILHLAFTTAIVLGAVIFPWMADNGLYAARLMQLKSAMRSAVIAAVQEIDYEESLAGLSQGFNETSGMPQTSEIKFDEELCRKVFGQMFKSASGLSEEEIKDYLTLVIVQPETVGIEYIISRGDIRTAGIVQMPNEIEGLINRYINFGEIDSKYLIYVEGNSKSNSFEKRPYIMAILKDFEIDGLFSKRNYTFIGFKAARINRRQ